jgi:hypothetical protein
MEDELERIRKEAFLVLLRYHPQNCLQGVKKTTKYLSQAIGVPAVILTECLPNTSLQFSPSTNLSGSSIIIIIIMERCVFIDETAMHVYICIPRI